MLSVTKRSKEAVKPVVDTVKQVIKDRKTDSPTKVLALKLLNSCVAPGHDELIMYMEKKIMSRLAVFARHRKVKDLRVSIFRSLVSWREELRSLERLLISERPLIS